MIFLRLLLILSPWIVFSQLNDDFSDGDFINNPAWFGNIDSFEIDSNFQLHLTAPANTSSSYISTLSSASVAGYWEFFVQLDFNPSNSNKAYIYLLSDSSNLVKSTQAYYVLVGNTDDEVSLYRKDGNTKTKIVDGTDDLLNSSAVKVKIKVERDILGNFSLYVDTSTSFNNYILQGSVFDNTYFHSTYFGVQCQYTSTRSDKFWLDDFTVTAQPYIDSFPPILDSFYIENMKEIKLIFNETIDNASSNTYFLNNVIDPVEITYSNQEISLRFAQDFFTSNTLQVNVIDDANNALDTSLVFNVNNTPFHSVLINEIYADQTPSFGMPDFEFIELKSSSNDTIFITDWKIADATDTALIPNDTLLPHAYIILCSMAADSAYSSFGKTRAIPNMPALNNSGDELKLLSAYNTIIDTVSYTNEWYHNEVDDLGNAKMSGGYSLERLFQDALCSPLFNWYPSVNSLGATPGTENSRANFVFPTNQIAIEEVNILNDTTIQLLLTNEAQGLSTQNIIVSDIDVEQVFISAPNELTIALGNPLNHGTKYYVELISLTDCFDNSLLNVKDSFFFYEPAQLGDLVINEILFNPRSGGTDFLEVYNTTGKALEVENFEIVEYIFDEPYLPSEYIVIEKMQFTPYSYTVFTKDTAILKGYHTVANSNWLVECTLPNFSDNENIVVIKKENETTFDSVSYNKRWHFELLDVQDGVSLERIDAKQESLDKSNWHSAARTYNYATPTAANSQQFNINNSPNITIEPEVFSPNNDGFKDFCLISYQNDREGNVLNLSVFDVQGRKVKDLALNELLGNNNTWKWNGTNNNFEKAPVGIYIILFELFNTDGRKKLIKKTVVVGTDLN